MVLLNSIYDLDLENIFLEVCVILKLYVTLFISVVDTEGGFSKIGLIKITQGQVWLKKNFII